MSEPETTTTAADLQRNFSLWQDRALRTPVTVTHHGRRRLVLVSAEEYDRLKRRDRQALRSEQLTAEEIAAIAAAQAPADAARFDGEID